MQVCNVNSYELAKVCSIHIHILYGMFLKFHNAMYCNALAK